MARRPPQNHRRRWSSESTRLLIREWGETTFRTLCTKLQRSRDAVLRKAELLGLSARTATQHLESLRRSAQRAGMHEDTLARILLNAGVRARRGAYQRSRRITRYYDPAEVDHAIAQWMRTETIRAAARRHGVTHHALERWLLASGDRTTGKSGKSHRIPSDVIDRVVEAHRNKQAQRRAA